MLFYIIYLILSPILWIIIIISSCFNFKIRENFFHSTATIKLANNHISQTKKKVLLFHAASAGEFEQLKPILSKVDRMKYCIIQSFTSPTIYNIEKNSDLFDSACYQPFDFLWSSYFYFKSINPDKYIITRHDIWPNHMMIAAKMGINCILINANIHKNSIWMNNFYKSFSKKILENFTHIMVPSLTIKNNLLSLNLKSNITVTGDSRYSQIINRYYNQQNIELLPKTFLNSYNIIFGSIDEQDEKLIFKTLHTLYPHGDIDLEDKNIKLIIVPHEVNDIIISRLSNHCLSKKLSFCLFSNIANNENAKVVIIDTVGILADLYKHSKIAYIGGGFSRGVHSVIEPAIYNNIIGFGPNIEMLDEAKDLLNKNLAQQIFNSKDMCKFINLNYMNKTSDRLQQLIFDKKNILKKILQIILE